MTLKLSSIQKLVQMWRQEYPELHYEEIDTELGTLVFIKNKIKYEFFFFRNFVQSFKEYILFKYFKRFKKNLLQSK